jgi:hypothetical protein
VFDQEPIGARVAPAVVPDADQHPTTLESFAGQDKFEVAGFDSVLGRLGTLRRPETAIPHLYRAAAVLALGDGAFEVAVVQRMIFHLHRQAFVSRIDRRPLGDGPRFEDAVQLQAKVIVQVARGMLLNDEPQMFSRQHLPRSARFLGFGEIALGSIGLELRFHELL